MFWIFRKVPKPSGQQPRRPPQQAPRKRQAAPGDVEEFANDASVALGVGELLAHQVYLGFARLGRRAELGMRIERHGSTPRSEHIPHGTPLDRVALEPGE